MENTRKAKYKSLAKDTGLFTISSFGSKILVFLLTPLYTSILSTSEYGIADLITTTIHFIYPILTLAIADATLRYALDKSEDKSIVFGVSTVFTLGATLVLLLLRPIICLIDESLNQYWLVFVLNFALFNIHGYFSNFVKGLGKTTLFAIQGLVQTVSIIGCNILFLVVFKIGLNGYLLSTLIGYSVPIIIMFFSAKLYRYIFPFRIDKNVLFDMLKYSIPMIPTILAWTINTSIDKYMIIGFYGLGESGVYSVAHKIPTIITTVLTVFTQAWQISVITNHGSSDESNYYTVVYNALDYVSIIGCLFLIMLCKFLAGFLFANDFYTAWEYVPMLIISAMFSSHSGFLAAAYRAAKKTTSLFISVLAGSIINVLLNLILLNIIGVLGAAIATAASFFIVWLFRVILIQKNVKVHVPIIPTIICYTILFFDATIVTLDFKYSWIIILLSFLVVCFLKRKTVQSMFGAVKNLIKSRKHH